MEKQSLVLALLIFYLAPKWRLTLALKGGCGVGAKTWMTVAMPASLPGDSGFSANSLNFTTLHANGV